MYAFLIELLQHSIQNKARLQFKYSKSFESVHWTYGIYECFF